MCLDQSKVDVTSRIELLISRVDSAASGPADESDSDTVGMDARFSSDKLGQTYLVI